MVGWLTDDVTLKPRGFCPTLVRADQDLSSFTKAIKQLITSGQKCRAVCEMSEDGECTWGSVDVDSRQGLLTPITRTFIAQIRSASKRGVTAPRAKQRS